MSWICSLSMFVPLRTQGVCNLSDPREACCGVVGSLVPLNLPHARSPQRSMCDSGHYGLGHAGALGLSAAVDQGRS